MLVMIVHAAVPVKEIGDKVSALMFVVVLFVWNIMFHFGSVLKIINLE
jgi:hypothetical protein